MPDFENNPLIQAIDAKRRAAEEARAAEPKVVSLVTRKAYEPASGALTVTVTNGKVEETPAKPKRRRRPKVDAQAVQILEDALEQTKAGEMAGAVVIARRPNGSFFIAIGMPAGGDANNEAAAFVAAAEILKQTLLDINEFGMEPVDEASELIFDTDGEPV